MHLGRLFERFTEFARFLAPSTRTPHSRGVRPSSTTRTGLGLRNANRIFFTSLNTCELCGTRFTDDRHKDGHFNSCQKLPNFDKIGSLEDELFGARIHHYAPSQRLAGANLSMIGPLHNFLGLFNSK